MPNIKARERVHGTLSCKHPPTSGLARRRESFWTQVSMAAGKPLKPSRPQGTPPKNSLQQGPNPSTTTSTTITHTTITPEANLLPNGEAVSTVQFDTTQIDEDGATTTWTQSHHLIVTSKPPPLAHKIGRHDSKGSGSSAGSHTSGVPVLPPISPSFTKDSPSKLDKLDKSSQQGSTRDTTPTRGGRLVSAKPKDFDSRPIPKEVHRRMQMIKDREMRSTPEPETPAEVEDLGPVDNLKDAEISVLKRKAAQLERARAELAAKSQADMRAMQLALTQITRVAQYNAKNSADRIRQLELEQEMAVQAVKQEAAETIQALIAENARLKALLAQTQYAEYATTQQQPAAYRQDAFGSYQQAIM